MQKANIVYRALRAGEMDSIKAGQGIVRREGITTPTQHVMGSKHFSNPFVSTTRALESAQFFATHGGLKPPGSIIAIDLAKVTQPVLDMSTPAGAAATLTHPRAINFAVKHREVLIKGGVNPEAIIEVVEE
jgi:hypothetical protein